MLGLRRGVAAALIAVALSLGSAVPAHADSIRNLEYWLSDYGFTQAWNTTQGAGVVVAVIDTGIGFAPDINDAVIGGADFSGIGSPDGRTPVGDTPQHATLVASLLAGRGTGPTSGVIGTAPQASLLSASVALGVDSPVSADDQIARAVRWSVDNGARVINMSLTRNSLEWPTSWDDAFSYAFSHDVVIVAATGNRGAGTIEVGAPATIPGVLTVAGLDQRGVASESASSQGITIAVAAPGEGLVGANPSGGYLSWSGSSGSAPIVSGLVALVRAAHPELDAANVIQRVIATATPVGSTPSPLYGYGKINAAAAVSASPVASVSANPLGSLAEWIRLYRRQASTATAQPAPGGTSTPLALPGDERVFPWMPTQYQLVTNGVPLAFFLLFGTLGVFGFIGVHRRRRHVAPRETSPHETVAPPTPPAH